MYKIEETLDHLLGTTVQEIKNSLFREFKSNDFNITTEQWSVLAKLHQEDGICQKDIANSLEKDKPTTTRILDLLEKKNFIIRIADDKDRRKFRVYLTQDGKDTANKLIPIAKAFQERLKANISEHEMELFTEILRKLNKNNF